MPEIQDVILGNPNKQLIDAGKKYNKTMRRYCYGEGLAESLTTIDGYEKESLRALRVKYAKSLKDLFNRLGRPIDKVFSSRGGSVYFNLGDTEDKRARLISMDVRGGFSAKKWVSSFWRPHFIDDPYGITFMEIAPQKEALKLRSQGKSFVYPTCKSIQSIYDYLPNGSSLEYVAFYVNKADKIAAGYKEEDRIYRLVDDAYDYWVKVIPNGGAEVNGKKTDGIQILTEHSFSNLFMYVPGIINSDIPDPNRQGAHLSFYDEILELAETYELKGSVKLTHEFLFAFPKYWEYADNCNKCDGTGHFDADVCPECNGKGKSIMSKVSDAKLLSWPQTKEDAIVTPNVAGFVSPDKTYYEIATHDLRLLEDLMSYTLWGASGMQQTQGMATDANGPTKTATEITSEIKPQTDRLEPITECAEKRIKFIMDAAIRIQISQNYPGCSYNLGRRYMIEGPDAIWEKYSKARKEGAAYSTLDDLLLDYYEAKYNSDRVKLAIQQKLMKVEPFIHLTAQQLQPLNASEDEYKAKLYFGEWLSTMNDATLISSTTEQLKVAMLEYVGQKKLTVPESKQLPTAA